MSNKTIHPITSNPAIEELKQGSEELEGEKQMFDNLSVPFSVLTLTIPP